MYMKQRKIIRRTEAQIRELLSLQESQDIAVTAFCRNHKIHKATFYNWRNKYSASDQSFIPVEFDEAAVQTATLFAEIEFPSKVSIRLFSKVDSSYFKALVR